MQKKILSVLLTLCMLLSMFPFAIFAGAEDDVIPGDDVVVEEGAGEGEPTEPGEGGETTDPETPDNGIGLDQDAEGNYLIGTAADMAILSAYVDAGNDTTGMSFLVTDNITLDETFNPIGGADADGNDLYFKGTFNGDGNTITVDLVAADAKGTGLFARAGGGAEIKNVNIAGALDIADFAYCGGLVGMGNGDLTITNCHSDIDITVTTAHVAIAGIVGAYDNFVKDATLTISGCSASGTITASAKADRTAGIIGQIFGRADNTTALVENCHSAMTIGASDNLQSVNNFGGIVGQIATQDDKSGFDVTVSGCYNTGDLYTSAQQSAGIVGCILLNGGDDAEITVVDCYNAGTVYSSNSRMGGVVGYIISQANTSSKKAATDAIINIENCYNMGDVVGNAGVGGVVGYLALNNLSAVDLEKNEINITNCYSGYDLANDEVVNCTIKCDAGYTAGILGYFTAATSTAGATPVLLDTALTLTDCANYSYVSGLTETNKGGYHAGILGLFQFKSISDNFALVLDNCDNYGEIHGSTYIGGIAGQMLIEVAKSGANSGYNMGHEYTFTGCDNYGDVTGSSTMVGGLVGRYDCKMQYSKESVYNIIKCSNYGDIASTSTGSGANYVGGLVGVYSMANSEKNPTNDTTKYYVDQCLNAGTVSFGKTGAVECGGLFGHFRSYKPSTLTFTNCLNVGTVNSHAGDTYVSGIIGRADASKKFTASNIVDLGTLENGTATSVWGGAVNADAVVSNIYALAQTGVAAGTSVNEITAETAAAFDAILNPVDENGAPVESAWAFGPEGLELKAFHTHSTENTVVVYIDEDTHAIVCYCGDVDDDDAVVDVVDHVYVDRECECGAKECPHEHTTVTEYEGSEATCNTNGLGKKVCDDCGTTLDFEAVTPFNPDNHASTEVEMTLLETVDGEEVYYDVEFRRVCCDGDDDVVGATMYDGYSWAESDNVFTFFVDAENGVELTTETDFDALYEILGSEEAPFKSLEDALVVADMFADAYGFEEDIEVYVSGTVNVPADYMTPNSDNTIKIIGGNEDATLYFANTSAQCFFLDGPVEISGITIFAETTKGVYFYARGNKLVMGEGLTMKAKDDATLTAATTLKIDDTSIKHTYTMNGAKVYVAGGYHATKEADVFGNEIPSVLNTDITVLSGEYWAIVGRTANDLKGSSFSGTANINIGSADATVVVNHIAPFSSATGDTFDLSAANVANIYVNGEIEVIQWHVGHQNTPSPKTLAEGEIGIVNNIYLNADIVNYPFTKTEVDGVITDITGMHSAGSSGGDAITTVTIIYAGEGKADDAAHLATREIATAYTPEEYCFVSNGYKHVDADGNEAKPGSTCANCGAEVKACEHAETVTEPTKVATCQEGGAYDIKCASCGAPLGTGETEIDPTNHVEGVDKSFASMTANGNVVTLKYTCCDATVDVTVVDGKVYVSDSGSDAVSATMGTEANPVKDLSFANAIAQAYADANESATIVVKGTATMAANWIEYTSAGARTGAHLYDTPHGGKNPVTITGGTLKFDNDKAADGTDISYLGIRLYAPLTIENITLTAKLSAVNIEFYARGFDLTFGEGIKMQNVSTTIEKWGVVTSDVKLWAFAGADGNLATVNNTLTIKSGDFYFVGGFNKFASANTTQCKGESTLVIGSTTGESVKLAHLSPFGYNKATFTTAVPVANLEINGEATIGQFAMLAFHAQSDNSKNTSRTLNIYYGEGDKLYYNFDKLTVNSGTKAKGAINLFIDTDNADALAFAHVIMPHDDIVKAIPGVCTVENCAVAQPAGITGNTTYVTYTLKDIDNPCGEDHVYGALAIVDGKYVATCKNCSKATLTLDEAIVYVNAKAAVDGNGYSAETPKKSLGQAMELVKFTGGTVVLQNDYSFGTATLPNNQELVTITSELDETGAPKYALYASSNGQSLILAGDVTFKNIKIGNTDSSKTTVIAAQWNNVTFKDTVSVGSIYLIAGGNKSLKNEEAEIATTITLDNVAVAEAAEYSFERVYLGHRGDSESAGKTIKNKTVIFNATNATMHNLWVASTSSATNNLQMENCDVTVNLGAGFSALTVLTGDGNTSSAIASGKFEYTENDTGNAVLDKLTININDGALIPQRLALRNVKDLTVNVAEATALENLNDTDWVDFSFSSAYVADGTETLTLNYNKHSFANEVVINKTGYATVNETVTEATGAHFLADVVTDATCTVGQMTGKACAACDYTEAAVETAPAKGHTYHKDAAGNYSCTVCQEAIAEVVGNVILEPKNIVATATTVTFDLALTANEALAGIEFTLDVPGFTVTNVENKLGVAGEATAFSANFNAEGTSAIVINLNGNATLAETVIATITLTADGTATEGTIAFKDVTVGAIGEGEEDVVLITNGVAIVAADFALVTNPCANGHVAGTTLVEKVAEVPATCTTAGTTAVMGCPNCDYTEGGAPIEALGHTELVEKVAEVPATCTTAGTTAVMGCTRCDYTEGGAPIEQLVHQYGEDDMCIYGCGTKNPDAAPNVAFIGETGYKTVQAAVDAVALFGTIEIAEGTVEAITPTKMFYLTGDVDGITIADGSDYFIATTTVDQYVTNVDEENPVKTFVCPPATKTSTTIKTKKSLELGASIKLNFYGLGSALDAYQDFFTIVSIDAARATINSEYVITVKDSVDLGKGTMGYRIPFPMIAAKEMGDTVTCTFYAITKSGSVETLVVTYSVKEFCMANIGGADANYNKLLAEILNYGAAAQVALNYKTDKLVNTGLNTDALKAYYRDVTTADSHADMRDTAKAKVGAEDIPGVTNIINAQKVGLLAEDAVVLKITFRIAKADLAKVQASTLYGTYTDAVTGEVQDIIIPGDKCEVAVSGSYYMLTASVNTIAAKNMRCEVKYSLYTGFVDKDNIGTPITGYRTTSIEAFATNQVGTEAELLPLAILAYSDAARIYFKK